MRGSSSRSWPSRVVNRSPARASRTIRWPPLTRAKSKKCSGCPSSSITKFEMSTRLLIGRCPASARRIRIAAGPGAMRSPLARAKTKRLQSTVSIVTRASCAGWPRVRSTGGSRSAVPKAAASSRAKPTIASASGRLGVTSTSSTGSPKRKCATTSVPGGTDSSSCMMPSSKPLGRQAQLVGRAQHALRVDAAHLARPDRQAAGELRTDAGDRNELAGGDVGRGGPRSSASRGHRYRSCRAAAGRRSDAARRS